MKDYCTFIFILILISAVSCSEPFIPELDTGPEEEEPEEEEPKVIEEVFALPENEPIGPLPADGGTVNQTGTVAFIAPSENALYLFDIGTGQTTFMTDSVRRDVRWSRDGEWIAYSGLKEAGVDDIFSGSVFMIKADGSGKRLVTVMKNDGKEGGVYPTEGITPVWSPDASRIAFTRIGFQFGYGFIHIIDIDTSGEIKEETVTNAGINFISDWSPDGKTIFFQSNILPDGSTDINYDWYTINQDGSNKQPIVDNKGTLNLYDFRYSPDGNLIAFIGGINDIELYIMDTDASNIRRITDNGGVKIQLSWSSDGTSIMYANDDWAMFIINIDRSGIKQLNIGMEIGRSFDWRPKN